VPTFDWRQLQRWGIDQTRLPEGSIVRFREFSAWEQYRKYILTATIIVALQSALIAGLVLQRARRRRSELELRENEAALRQVYGQNQDLAGRLINAQEEERTRIARELHDDVSQQLAGVGIMLSGLRRKIGRPDSEADIDRTIMTLQDRTSALAEAIRTLSHQLHPSVLEHVGLVATLRRHCTDVEELYRLSVVFNSVGRLESLGADVALCLFRVTQEALTNAVRHARAHNIAVDLIAAADHVELRIKDDGIGFVAGERTGRGLGLRSIDERVRLVRGSLSVESQPGHGATLHVRIPLAVAPIEDVSEESRSA
jgi:two-component system sensor histidine kinase UhpB